MDWKGKKSSSFNKWHIAPQNLKKITTMSVYGNFFNNEEFDWDYVVMFLVENVSLRVWL